MQWKWCNELIVQEYNVILVNWPLAVFEVKGVGLKDLELVLNKLVQKECVW